MLLIARDQTFLSVTLNEVDGVLIALSKCRDHCIDLACESAPATCGEET